MKSVFLFGIFNIWKSFSVALLLFISPVVFANFIPFSYFPFLMFILAFSIFGYIRKKRHAMNADCMLIPFIIARVLLWYAILIGVLELLIMTRNGGLNWNNLGDFHTLLSCKFPILLLAPLLTLNTLIVLMDKGGMFCKLCKVRNGFPSDRSFYGSIHNQEMARILDQIFVIGALLTIAGWTYFIFLFNTSDINNYDKLVFTGVPLLVCLIHEVAMLIRCTTIVLFRSRIIKDTVFKREYTCCRFIVIKENEILLKYKKESEKWDSPITLYIPYEEKINLNEVKARLKRTYNIFFDDMIIYSENIDRHNKSSVIHFIGFLNSNNNWMGKEYGKWCGATQIENLMKDSLLVRAFRHEIYKIFTILRTIKTYDENGKRRYNIKSYIPSLTIADIYKIKEDLDNPKWEMIAFQNDDNRILKLRRIWYKYIEGIFD